MVLIKMFMTDHSFGDKELIDVKVSMPSPVNDLFSRNILGPKVGNYIATMLETGIWKQGKIKGGYVTL